MKEEGVSTRVSSTPSVDDSFASPPKPLAIDLYCGLGGWSEGCLAEGYDVIGFDIEQHVYGEDRYPGWLVIQDVLTLHGSQFKDAALIVASPPCQEYSYMAMPWTRAKAKAAAIRADETGAEIERLNALFNACFRIQREACEAAGWHIPMVVENVQGAIPWVGRSRWNYGSYHLWGDVPALMPAPVAGRMKYPVSAAPRKWRDRDAVRLNDPGAHALHVRIDRTPVAEGRKGAGAGAAWFDGNLCQLSSKSPNRKAASAKIAKIPLPLSRYIAATYKPRAILHAESQAA